MRMMIAASSTGFHLIRQAARMQTKKEQVYVPIEIALPR